jgi:hypothetical protein
MIKIFLVTTHPQRFSLLHFLPSPALSGSGPWSMISARYFKAPPKQEVEDKIKAKYSALQKQIRKVLKNKPAAIRPASM